MSPKYISAHHLITDNNPKPLEIKKKRIVAVYFKLNFFLIDLVGFPPFSYYFTLWNNISDGYTCFRLCVKTSSLFYINAASGNCFYVLCKAQCHIILSHCPPAFVKVFFLSPSSVIIAHLVHLLLLTFSALVPLYGLFPVSNLPHFCYLSVYASSARSATVPSTIMVYIKTYVFKFQNNAC